ncbi:hypothetical protein APV28_3675 [Comamonas testosteroni]|nr:hypothetical protein APV28_3675 [Comamonas testosteroni]
MKEIWLLLHGRAIVSGRLQKWADTRILRPPKGLLDRQ